MSTEPIAPQLEYALTVELELGERVTTPTTTTGAAYGQVIVTAGKFHGPRLSGEAVPGGGDFPTIGADGVARLDATYFLREDDGTLIRLKNSGLRVSTPEARERFLANLPVRPEDYTLIATPSFNAPVGPHDWLNHSIFVGIGRRSPTGNIFDYYRVL